MYVPFKGKVIINYYHVSCSFGKMQKARVESNVIQNSKEIDGFECISKVDQSIISKCIKVNKDLRTTPFTQGYKKKSISMRRRKLKVLNSPSIKIMFTNADQFIHSKKNELQNRIITEKPMIIAVSEVKPKNVGDLSQIDYNIEGDTINPFNIETNTGRGIII